jgi:hypothetical protein
MQSAVRLVLPMLPWFADADLSTNHRAEPNVKARTSRLAFASIPSLSNAPFLKSVGCHLYTTSKMLSRIKMASDPATPNS